MTHPIVAILLTTYNGEIYLKQQLDSIFAQTYTNFRLYISDDCSNDRTQEIIQEYKQKYPTKIIYTANKKNIGYVRNFEKLLNSCVENYIAFSDQDDVWELNKIEVLLENMLSLESETFDKIPILIHSDLNMIDENNKILSHSYFQYRSYKLKNKKDLGNILGPCGVMGNTLLINDQLKKIVLPFPKSLDVHDYWIAVNAELFGKRKTLFKSFVHYRIHKNNVSNSQKILKKQSVSFFSRDIKLPNLETNRKLFLPLLLEKVQDKKDKKILKAYINYLNFQGNRFKVYFDLIHYSLIKRDFLVRIKIFFKLFWTKRYE